MKRSRVFGAFLAAAMIATSCGQRQDTGAVAPAVDDTINTEAAFPDDGLSHFIVTPIAGAPISPDTTASAGGSGGRDAVVDPSAMLTPGMVADMPPGASLEARDGVVGYLDLEGVFVPLEGAPPAATVAPATEPAVIDEVEAPIVMRYGNPYIDALAAEPAVESVTVIGDGTFGVSVSDPDVIDARVFAIADDVPFGIASDQLEGYQWALENDGTNLRRVNGGDQTEDADLDIGATLGRVDGKGIVVAVIDSGVDFSHPDLENSSWSNLGEICDNGIDDEGNGFIDDCHGWDFANNDATPFNSGADSHGTHVSGIITANRDGRGVAGIAPNARIMDLNVARRTDRGDSISGASVTAAIRYAVDNGADIINVSLASQPGASARSVAPVGAAIDYAAAKGVVVVVAAGNNSVDLGSLAVYPASFNRSNMIVVGASTPSDTRASFSNFNAEIVDVYAPGVHILSTVPGDDFLFFSGTSQASPATAAVAALVMEANPDASMTEVIDTVTSTVDQSDALATSTASGRVNAATAIGAQGAPLVPTELTVHVAGLFDTGNEVNATIEIATPPDEFDEAYVWDLSLLYTDTNGTYAIVDHPIRVAGDVLATGPAGTVPLADADTSSIAVGVTLPAGRYSFVVEAVPVDDPTMRLGDAFVTTFDIGGDPDVSIDTTPPTTVPVVPEDSPVSTNPDASDPATAPMPGVNPDAVSGGSTSSGAEGSSGVSAPSDPSSSPAGTSPAESSTAPSGAGGAEAPSTGGSDVSDRSGPTLTVSGAGGGNDLDPPSSPTPNGSSSPVGSAPAAVPDSPPPVPTEVGNGEASDGAWAVTSISPQAGYVNGANTVIIRGSFPADAYVWFGDQPGQVVHQNATQITVRTPLRADAGLVDVTVRTSSDGTVLSIADAYAFVAFDGSVGSPQPGSGSRSSTDDAGADSGSTDDRAPGGDRSNQDEPSPGTDSGGEADDADAGDSTGDDSASSDADDTRHSTATSSDRRARTIVGGPLELSNGLRGASITPNPAIDVPVCGADSCSAARR